jgi:hypothetical protein
MHNPRMMGARTQIWFDGPDEAYLVAAAIRRHLDATLVSDVLLVPTPHGPTLELPATAAEDPLVMALVRRFGGHVDGGARGPAAVPPTPMLEQVKASASGILRRR